MENEKKISRLGIGVVVFCIMFALLAVGYLTLSKDNVNEKEPSSNNENNNNNEETDKLDVSYYEYDMCVESEVFEQNGYIYDRETVVYDCQDKENCGFISDYIFDYCNDSDKLALIYDGDKKMLYDYGNMKVVFEADDFASTIYQGEDNLDYAYLLFKKNGKVGIMSIEGRVLVDAIYDDIGLASSEYDGEYNIARNVITATKDGKVGVIKMETGEVVVPFDYDHIKIYDNNYVLRNNDSESLVDLDLKPILDGFKRIDIFYDLAFAEKDSKITLYDLNGNQYSNEWFNIKNSYDNNSNTGYYVYSMDEEDKILTIEVKDGKEHLACYDFDVEKKMFTELDCNELVDDIED